MKDQYKADKEAANRDPITGAPGSHPVGVGIGAAAGGAAAGAAAGTMAAGPVGTVVGAAVGAVVGGLGGKAVAERLDPTVETAFWRENHARQPYATADRTFDDFEPAYRTGWEGRSATEEGSFDAAEPRLRENYEAARGNSTLEWQEARAAARAAWDRTGTPI